MIAKKIPLLVKCPKCLKVFMPDERQTPGFYETYGSVSNNRMWKCANPKCEAIIDVALVARKTTRSSKGRKG